MSPSGRRVIALADRSARKPETDARGSIERAGDYSERADSKRREPFVGRVVQLTCFGPVKLVGKYRELEINRDRDAPLTFMPALEPL